MQSSHRIDRSPSLSASPIDAVSSAHVPTLYYTKTTSMKTLIFIAALLLVAIFPETEACRQKRIQWYKMAECHNGKGQVDRDCWQIEANMRAYSDQNEGVYGPVISADSVCYSCLPSRKTRYCLCTIRAWRYKEWMLEPGMSHWPSMPGGWQPVNPENGSNGWEDTGHKPIDCTG